MREEDQHEHKSRRPKTPLWKWVVIILLIIAMPLFFSFVRTVQLQRALNSTAPQQ